MKKTKIRKLVLYILVLSQLMSIQAFAVSKELNVKGLNLTQEQINLKIEEINNKYKIGEAFSKSDSEFILEHTSSENKGCIEENDFNITYTTDSIDQNDFDFTDSSADGMVTATCRGYTFGDLNIINHSFGANYITVINEGAECVEKIQSQVSCTAYGLVGSDGLIGKIYEETLSSSTTSQTTWNFDESENFSGAVLTMFVNAKSIITYTNGSFSIN